MWINSKKYKSLVEHNNNLSMQLEFCQGRITSLYNKIDVLDKLHKESQTETELYKNLCEEYKQKYADEVQKRLELIEFYERQTDN